MLHHYNPYNVAIIPNPSPVPLMSGKWYSSPIVGGIIGVFSGGLTILVLEAAGHTVFGTGEPMTPETFSMANVTMPMLLSVLVAWVVGCFVAGTVATMWTGSESVVPGVITGLILLAASVWNMTMIPHPAWMAVAAVVLMPSTAFLGARLRVARRAS